MLHVKYALEVSTKPLSNVYCGVQGRGTTKYPLGQVKVVGTWTATTNLHFQEACLPNLRAFVSTECVRKTQGKLREWNVIRVFDLYLE